MIHSPTLNNKINHLHEKALRIASADLKSSFNELLQIITLLRFITEIFIVSQLRYLQFWTGFSQI